MLKKLLLADLQHLYFFEGKADQQIKWWQLLYRCFTPRFMPVVLYRLSYSCKKRHLGILARFLSFLNFVLFGIEIAMRCEIGGGLVLAHTVGTVIGAEKIGTNALIYHGATLGAKEMDIGYTKGARPTVGDNVTIGSGAKILGNIVIGNNVVIGANAVVIKSMPDNVVIGGIPAKILRKKE